MFNLIKKTCSYFHRNIFLPKLLIFRYRDLLNKNSALYNSHSGQRCFIVGSGPSINELDFAKLKSGNVFVMSEFNKHPKYSELMPEFYVIADPNYGSQDPNNYYANEFKKLCTQIPAQTKIFLNAKIKNLVEKNNLLKDHQVFYIVSQGIMSENFNFNISIDKVVPWPKNSLLFCLEIAAYMGFKEIFLLGCEHSYLSQPIGRGHSATLKHGYPEILDHVDMSDLKAVKKFSLEHITKLSYENNVASILQLFKNYRLFYKKAKKLYPEIKIFNATPNSFLDVFPVIKFEDIKFDGK